MKILAFSDIHGDMRKAEKLAQQADKENVDLVVLAGDITYNEQSTDNLIGPFVKRNKKVVLIPGNHETVATADFLAELYGVTNLHGYSIKSGDVGIFGAGGANIGLFKIEENEMFELMKKGHDKVKDMRKKIMISHVHPSGTKMEDLTDIFPGSTGLRRAIDTFHPDILICGHVHEAQGIEEMVGNTRVINVGKEGKILDI